MNNAELALLIARLADATNDLAEATKAINSVVENHEKRIRALEAKDIKFK